ncbi:MAG: autoinducer binding domain-containing protein, partial [Exilibacterium sp.]
MQDHDESNQNHRVKSRDGNFLAQLSDCSTVKQFKHKVHTMVSQLGLSDFSFTVVNDQSTKCLTTLPDRVRQHYLKNHLAECDLLMEHAQIDGTPLLQSAIEDYIAQCPFSSERFERNRKYFELLAGLGYHDGYCVPYTSANPTLKALFTTFSRGSDRVDFREKIQHYEVVIPFLAEAIAYFGFNLFSDYFLNKNAPPEPSLTPKPLKLLSILAKDGLSLKESAHKLCISVDTANKHVAA